MGCGYLAKIANKDAEGNLDGTYTVTLPVVDANGRISPVTTQYFPAGASTEFNLLPDTGYAASAVEVDGQIQSWSGTKYVFAGAQGGSTHTLKVTFTATPLAGTGTPGGIAKRLLGSMGMLARTGDGTAPRVLAMASAACAGLGVALLTRNRRRKEYPRPL
ncbi:hypothetical protein [Adlercreutzia murintestinalis]|uniref:hypothetical protein n=1 Tax=Adlercreutzia murintestinalis TaxID=2941325 RepID=UPI0020414EED|nr:hypothetical protein [Adlercreutzia murintestinalis]